MLFPPVLAFHCGLNLNNALTVEQEKWPSILKMIIYVTLLSHYRIETEFSSTHKNIYVIVSIKFYYIFYNLRYLYETSRLVVKTGVSCTT